MAQLQPGASSGARTALYLAAEQSLQLTGHPGQDELSVTGASRPPGTRLKQNSTQLEQLLGISIPFWVGEGYTSNTAQPNRREGALLPCNMLY